MLVYLVDSKLFSTHKSLDIYKSAICISLMRAPLGDRMAIICNLRHGRSGFSESLFLRALTLNCSHRPAREFGKFRDVTENCRVSCFYLARLHYERPRATAMKDPCDDRPRSMTVFKSDGTNTRKIVEDDATGWPCRLTKRIFRQTGLIDVHRTGFRRVALLKSRNFGVTVAAVMQIYWLNNKPVSFHIVCVCLRMLVTRNL